jgi:hypothetical protein
VTGQPLKEANIFHTPLQARFLTNAKFSDLPTQFSLATLVEPSSGLITAAKLGEYNSMSQIFRVYIPDNQPRKVVIYLADTFHGRVSY